MAERTFMWRGASGREYEYLISPIGSSFADEPGNYIFAKETAPGRWTAIYIGEAKSLRDKLSAHDRLACVVRFGGTHIHAHPTPGERDVRWAEEADLLEKWDPPCNKA